MDAMQVGSKTYRWDENRKRLVITSASSQEEMSAGEVMELLALLYDNKDAIREAVNEQRYGRATPQYEPGPRYIEGKE